MANSNGGVTNMNIDSLIAAFIDMKTKHGGDELT
jgi:hypothetical protein